MYHHYEKGIIHLARAASAEVWPSIGGWSLSNPLPVMAKDAAIHARFCQQCVELIEEYGFDGIDINWNQAPAVHAPAVHAAVLHLELGASVHHGDHGRWGSTLPYNVGGTDDGLVDVRPHVELWGLESEIACWHELREKFSEDEVTDMDISEMMLNEDWPSKLRKAHLKKIESVLSVSHSSQYL